MQPVRPLITAFLLASSGFAQTSEVTATPVSEPLPAEAAHRIYAEGMGRSQALRLLRDLTGKVGHRLTGSDNFTRACKWAAAEFHAMGLQNVQIEKWGEWKLGWNRGVWIGRIVSPVQLDMYVATSAWTAGTKGLQKAEVVLEASGEDKESPAVAGKWVLSKRKFGLDRTGDEQRAAVCRTVGEAGGLGVIYRAADPDRNFPTRVRVFGSHETALLPLEEVPTTPQIAVQADHFDQLLDLVQSGKSVACEFNIENTFRAGPIELHNVIAEIPGTEKPDEVVIVCGHLDSWHQKQGTTDNGTGATSTMEAARILAAVGVQPKRTIRFCLWGGEEEGLLGSRAYVQKHRTEMPKVSAVFNHDTGTNWAQSLSVTHAMKAQLAPVFAHVTRLLVPPDADWKGNVFDVVGRDQISGGRGGSDNASFLAVGVPGLNWGLRGRSNYFAHTWHTQWDTIDNAIEEYQRHTSTVIAMAALGTANLDALLDRANIIVGGGGGGRGAQSATLAAGWFGAEMEGFKFTSVKADGRAAKLGVQVGDVLKKVGGQAVEQPRQIFQFARETEGDTVTFTFQRGEQTFDVQAKKEDLPQPRGGQGGNPGPGGGTPPGAGTTPPTGGGTPPGGNGGEEEALLVLR
ncbi:MAG TPA: M20/M25/M40 family metallo-hydrolase [Planctomycetota bacterium]